MAKYPGLMRRGTKWYLRAWVPEDLQHVIGRKDIWKSLRTGDYSVAKARYIEERVRVEREFAAARNGPPPIGGEEVRQAVADWFASYDQNLAGVDFNTHGPGRRDALDQSQVDWATVTHGEEEQVLGSVQAVADEILTRSRSKTHDACLRDPSSYRCETNTVFTPSRSSPPRL